MDYKKMWEKLTTKLQEDSELLNKLSQDCFIKTPEQIKTCNIRIKYNNDLRFYVKELEKEKDICFYCNQSINPEDFMDKYSIQKFKVFGYCQKCQSKVFEEV